MLQDRLKEMETSLLAMSDAEQWSFLNNLEFEELKELREETLNDAVYATVEEYLQFIGDDYKEWLRETYGDDEYEYEEYVDLI
jgi:uncharacterized membrane protein YheB (UPF0754 family)